MNNPVREARLERNGPNRRRTRSLSEILLERGWITEEQVREAQDQRSRTKLSLQRTILNLGYVTQTQLQAVSAEQQGYEFVNLTDYSVDTTAASMVPESLAKRYGAIPIGFEDGKLIVAQHDPQNVLARDDIRALTGREVKTVVAPREEIEELFVRLQQLDRTTVELVAQPEAEDEDVDLDHAEEDAPIVRAIDRLIGLALQRRASDIHIEPFERDVRIRFRIDGVLHEQQRSPKTHHAHMVSRIKIMASMNIAERRVPQDGQISLSVQGRGIDIRVATMPSLWGEKVVLRLLERTSSLMRLEDLGFLPDSFDRYKQAFRRPYGIILVTGPTGSGKSTTLFATLNILNDPQKNIITVEDPIEYRLPGLTQVQLHKKAGLTFASALTSILRSDPDIVMVGEMRDAESAKIAIEVALTGHLVLSTLHTNDAPSAVTRLTEMGIEPFLVASAVICVVGQRLARRLCPRCKVEYEPTPDQLVENAFPWHEGQPLPRFYQPAGCTYCSKTGYRGRVAVVEVMSFTEEIGRLTAERRSSEEIKRVAIQQGMQTLREDGLEKVRLGETSLAEILRAV